MNLSSNFFQNVLGLADVTAKIPKLGLNELKAGPALCFEKVSTMVYSTLFIQI
jgi:hypothetical protein